MCSMDRFLHNFKSKVNSLKKQEMSENDWQSFLEYKKIHGTPVVSKFYGRRKFRLAMASAVSVVAISLFAIFIKNHYDFSSKKFTNTKNKTAQSDTASFYSLNRSDQISTDSFNTGFVEKNDYNFKNTHLSENKKTSDSKSITGIQSVDLVKQNSKTNSNESTNKKPTISFTEHKMIEFETENRIESYVNLSLTDIKNSSEIQDLKNEINNVDIINTKNIVNTAELEKLRLKIFEITNNTGNQMPDTTIIYVINSKNKTVRKPGLLIGGSLAFIKPIKDRFSTEKSLVKKISAEYYIGKKMRIGINYSQSNNLSKIDKKEKNPHLKDINPHRPDVKVEELTMKTQNRKIGIETSYDIFRSKKMIGSIGLGIKHDISNDYNFRFKLKENDEKPYFEEQENKFLIKRRNYIVPKIGFEYQLINNLRLKSQIEYEASISDFSEKYLTFEAGIAYGF